MLQKKDDLYKLLDTHVKQYIYLYLPRVQRV